MKENSTKLRQETAKHTITSFIQKHSYTIDEITTSFVRGHKQTKNVKEIITVHYKLCSQKAEDNWIKIHTLTCSEHDHLSKETQHTTRQEAQFTHEELLKDGHEIKTIEKCMEHAFVQQKNHTQEILTHHGIACGTAHNNIKHTTL